MKRAEVVIPPNDKRPVYACSFCGRTMRDCESLIAGPAVFICDVCVSACVEIIAEEKREREFVGFGAGI